MAVTGDGSLSFDTVIDNSGLVAGSQDAVGIISRMGSQISKLNPFAGLALLAVSAFAIISKSSYDMMKEFEHSMKEVATISAAATDDFKGISDKVFAISRISPDGPKKLAEAYYQIVSAGYDGAKGLELLTIASKAAVAGVTDTQTAADGITTVLNAFKMEAEESEEVADIFFNTVKLGKTNFEQLSASMSNVAPLAAANNISFTEISAAIASLTKQGVPTSQAITQIRASIISANKALGDGWSDAMTYQEGLQAIYDKAGGSQNELQKLVGSVESMNAVLVIAGDNLSSSMKDLDSYTSAVGSTQRATDKMLSSNTNQWAIFGNTIKASTQGIGEGWLEVSNSIAKSLNHLIGQTKDFTQAVSEEAAEYSLLKGELDGVNTEAERKIEILTILKDKYPEYLKSLDLDKIAEKDLNDVLREVKTSLEQINALYDKRIELSGALNLVESARAKKGQLSANLKEQQMSFFKAVTEAQIFAEKNNIELEFSISDPIDEIYNKISETLLNFEGRGLGKVFFGDANAIVKDMYEAANGASIYKKELSEATIYQQQMQEHLEAQNVALFDTKEHFHEIVAEINTISDISKLTDYDVYTMPEIKTALDSRRAFLTESNALHKVSLDEYKENKAVFSEYINSGNEEIIELAKKRKEAFDKYLSGGSKDPDGQSSVQLYVDFLKLKREAYVNYENAKLAKGTEFADKEYANLVADGENYMTYLETLLDKVTGNKMKTQEIIREIIGGNFEINTPEIEAKINYIEELYNNLGEKDFKFKNPTKNDFSLKDVVDEYKESVTIINRINQEKLDILNKQIKNQLSEEYKDRKKALDKQHKVELLSQKKHFKNIIENTPLDYFEKQFETMGGNTVDYFSLADEQLAHFLEQVQNIYLTPEDEKKLFSAGMTQDEIEEFKQILEDIKSAKKGGIIDATTSTENKTNLDRIAGIFNVVGREMDNEMGVYIQDLGNLALSISSTFKVLNNENSNALDKAGSLIGLIIQAANIIGKVFGKILDKSLDKHISHERDMLKAANDRLSAEIAINELYRRRAEIERNSSAFFDSDYKLDFQAAIKQAFDSEVLFGEAMNELMTNGLISGTGEASYLLGDAKRELNLTIQDLIAGIDPTNRNVWEALMDSFGRSLDPLDFFGGRSKMIANERALEDLREGFESALMSMGKTMSDIANFSVEEWIELLTILEASGNITDEATKGMLENARQLQEEYLQAMETMKGIINTVAGQLKDDLSESLINAFETGVDAAEDFADKVNDILNDLFMQTLMMTIFKPMFDQLQEEMVASMDIGGDKDWGDDIVKFTESLPSAIDEALLAMEQWDKAVEEAGYDGFNTSEDDPNSLSGSIQNITEDTAEVLAGTLNAIRIDVRNGLEIAESSLKQLVRIGDNTEYNKYLESMDTKLSNIETALS